jgi:hypothetical protein
MEDKITPNEFDRPHAPGDPWITESEKTIPFETVPAYTPPQIRWVVDYGIPGQGPDASGDSFTVCATWTELADELRSRLEESAEGVKLHADVLAEAGDYQAAWHTRARADDMWQLADTLSNDRASAPLYADDPAAWDMTIEEIVTASFPLRFEPGCAIYAFPSDTYGADEPYDPDLDPADGAHTAAAYQAEIAGQQ